MIVYSMQYMGRSNKDYVDKKCKIQVMAFNHKNDSVACGD